MREIMLYVVFILFITVLMPLSVVIGFDTDSYKAHKYKAEYKVEDIKEDKAVIEVYNTKTKKVEKMEMDEYLKGVVAAEMPAAFHIEALKAQAVAARTYAVNRLVKFKDGNPAHPEAALCTDVHCQAWLSKEDLVKAHDRNWAYDFWPKIEEAVESTKGEVITYSGEVIEPLFHSTSGGMTEDSEAVFANKVPYLRSVPSPNEDASPKFKGVVSMTIDDFIKKVTAKYPKVYLTKDNLTQKIKLIEKTTSGRISTMMIDNEVVTGRDMRDLLGLNSTNFKIVVDSKFTTITFETLGNGHGVGMSQWGANSMGKNGSKYEEILKHYYTGVEIEEFDKKLIESQ